MAGTTERDARTTHVSVDHELAADEPCLLDALCAAALSEVPALSATLCVQTDCGPMIVAGSTQGVAGLLVDHEVACGEGPVTDAAVRGRPVVLDDLASDLSHRWHGFVRRASAVDVGAVWALPVQTVGKAPVVLELSFSSATGPAERDYRTGQSLASVAGRLIDMDAVIRGEAACLADLDALLAQRAVIYQAQGMCMARLDTDATGALARMRAVAIAHGGRLQDVAQDIVDRGPTHQAVLNH